MKLPFTRKDLMLETREVSATRPMSLSGAQPKCSMVLHRGKFHVAQNGEVATHLFKPYPKEAGFRFESDIPANEYLTMQIAKDCFGIKTAKNTLAYFADGEPVYVTKRFDRDVKGKCLCQEDFAQLLGGDKYKGSYEEIADYIRERSTAPIVDLLLFYRLVIFNVVFSNADAHKKNFSFLEYAKDDYRLSPSYDLLNTSLHIKNEPSRMALELFIDNFESDYFQKNGFHGSPDFCLFGERLGLPQAKIESILTEFLFQKDVVLSYINQSLLSDEAKSLYRQSFLDRLKIF